MQGSTSGRRATSKLSFEETLLNRVILNDRCSGCAACVLVCPFLCLEYLEEKPSLAKECEICGICPKVCPRYEFSESALERLVFNRESNPEERDFGVHRRLVIAQASGANIRRTCQDGGVVSALLIHAMKSKLIDGAIVSTTSAIRPLFPVPKVVTKPLEVLRCAGTRYTYSPNLLALRDAVKGRMKSLAFVGTPCQIEALRKIEAFPLKKYSNVINFAIGLMCTESFSYEGLMQKHIRDTLGIDLSNIQKMNIKGKVIVTSNSGKVETIPLREAKQYTRKGCLRCTDFSARLADVSAGGLGLEGWTFTILRTERGEKLFESAENAGVLKTRPVEEEIGALNLLVKLSERKRRNART